MKRRCAICGTPFDTQTAVITKNICNNPECQRRAEYFPLLEPLGSIIIKCPHCQRNIIMVIHKEAVK